MTAEPRREPIRWPRAAGWFPTDQKYSYSYSPRLEHFFNGSEYSYCGMIGIWSTDRQATAVRRCKWCMLGMINDGLLRVSATRRGAW